jgi:uncharacterized protein (TIGR03086 family)
MSEQAARHRCHAETFAARADAVEVWDVRTPVPDWTARDVVGHLIEWFPPFLVEGSGITLPAGPSVEDDPAGAWQHHADAVQAILDDDDSASMTFAHPYIPVCPLPEAIDRFYTTDVFMHTWDLARATGQDDHLDTAECVALLAAMQPMDEMLRSSGQYGPKVAVAADADPVLALMAFIGRDPTWSPATGG